MPPYLVFALGALVGAGATLLAPGLSRNGRPMLKEAVKTAMLLAREAQVRGAELIEMAEDLYAEAKAEAAAAPAAATVVSARRASAPQRKRAPARKAAAKARPRATARRVTKPAQDAATTDA
jgi:hypothetical protein